MNNDLWPSAWRCGALDFHDQTRTGQHDPNDCRFCLRVEVTRLGVEVARLQKALDEWRRHPLGFKLE